VTITGEEASVRPRRTVVIAIMSGGLAFSCLSLLGGCSDESRTTGTQLQISPAVKAELDDMKSAQKEVREERKAEKAARKKAR
jgi:hypothetical protein